MPSMLNYGGFNPTFMPNNMPFMYPGRVVNPLQYYRDLNIYLGNCIEKVKELKKLNHGGDGKDIMTAIKKGAEPQITPEFSSKKHVAQRNMADIIESSHSGVQGELRSSQSSQLLSGMDSQDPKKPQASEDKRQSEEMYSQKSMKKQDSQYGSQGEEDESQKSEQKDNDTSSYDRKLSKVRKIASEQRVKDAQKHHRDQDMEMECVANQPGIVSKVIEKDNYYHMVFKNNSSTKGTSVDED